MEVQGYPSILILIVLGIGVPLALLRSYSAFLFGLLVIVAGNTARFNQTRLPGLGPFLNMADACLFVMLVAFFFDRIVRKKPIKFPPVVGLLLLVLSIGAIQSLWKLGWTYDTIRASRWALDLPFGLFLGANMVTTAKRTQSLIAILLLGTVLSAGQHVFLAASIWHSMSLTMDDYHLMRTIAYGGMSGIFLLTAVIWEFPRGWVTRVPYLLVGALLLASQFLNQTRSLWLASVGTIPCLVLLFPSQHLPRRVLRLSAALCIIVAVFLLLMHRAMPGIDPLKLAESRILALAGGGPISGSQTATRERDFEVEMSHWWEGTLVLGRGLAFFQTIPNPKYKLDVIAFGHLGYVTYLCQLGLVGLFAYGVYLPLRTIHAGRLLWRYSDSRAIQYLGLLGTASVVCLSITFLMSGSFLNLGACTSGVLYGALWSLAPRAERQSPQWCLGNSGMSENMSRTLVSSPGW